MPHTRIEQQVVLALLCAGCQYDDFGDPLVCAPDVDAEQACDIFSAEEWSKVRELSIVTTWREVPASPGNRWADDGAAASLGQKLFFDECFAGTNPNKPKPRGKSCATCHQPDAALQEFFDHPDARRNTPTIIDVSFYEWWPWDGRRDSLWTMALLPIEGDPLSSDRLNVARRVRSAYGDEYLEIFCADAAEDDAHCTEDVPAIEGDWAIPGVPAWDSLTEVEQAAVNRTYVNVGKALEAYMRQIRSAQTRFDDFVAGDPDAIDDAAKRGLRLFIDSEIDCVDCHSGPDFSDDEFHVIGLPPTGWEDLGRYRAIEQVKEYEFNSDSPYSDDSDDGASGTLDPSAGDKGAFRTKHLRGVAQTGRFMHAGQFATLEETVRYYGEHDGTTAGLPYTILDDKIKQLDLSEDEIADLVAFLESLSFPPVSPFLYGTEADMAALPACN